MSCEVPVDVFARWVYTGSGRFRLFCCGAGGVSLQAVMFGLIRIDYDRRADALVVPRVALPDDQGTPAVYAVRDGQAVRVPVKTGYTDGHWTEILGGLKIGDAVVTAGQGALSDGSAVQGHGETASIGRAPGTECGCSHGGRSGVDRR